MADGLGSGAGVRRWDEAVEQVDRWLTSSFAGVSRLGIDALRLYPHRAAKSGWRLSIAFTTGALRFDILVGYGFPFEPPRLALVDRPPHLTWPHLEADGYLCLLPSSASVASNDPIAVLTHLLAEAVEWVEASEAGTNTNDFRSEFRSYWSTQPGAPQVKSLLDARGPSRQVLVHRGRGLYIVADSAEPLSQWLDHALASKATRQFDPALLVWLDEPPLPSEYPSSVADVVRLVRRAGLGSQLDQLGAEQLKRITVIIGAPTANGPALAAVVLRPRSAGQGRGATVPSFGGLERGFRPGHIPPDVLAQRFLGSTRSSTARVERIDACWIHGRDADPDLLRLRAARVAVVGCGSLGGPIALGLAQTGVGALDLIDPETLEAGNVGRHPLGASAVGAAKADALASRIRSDYPHILRAEGHVARWEDLNVDQPDIMGGSDLIVSTIGDWSAEGFLNAWRYDRGTIPNIIFGWTEPHGVAGHAVGLFAGPGCLACGLSSWGEPQLTAAEWPDGAGQRGEPACGVMFQAYGPVEASHIAAVITGAAIDVLIGRVAKSFHRVWVGRESVLAGAGGVWSRSWKTAHGDKPLGAQIVDLDWPARPGCSICGRISS